MKEELLGFTLTCISGYKKGDITEIILNTSHSYSGLDNF